MCCIVKCCNCHILLAVDMAGVACQGLVCACVCVCEVGKMVKDIGMTIRKGIVVSFLPCLGIPSLYVLSCFKMCFFVTCFCCFWGGGERYEWCLDGVVVWGR